MFSHLMTRPFIFWVVMTFGLVQTLRQDVPNQVTGLVTGNKMDVSVLNDTTMSMSILFLVLLGQINCKGGHPLRVSLPKKSA